MKIDCPISEQAKINPEVVAVCDQGRNYSYSDINQIILNLQYFFTEKKLQSGDKVVLFIDNPFHLFLCMWSLLRLNIAVLPINHKFPNMVVDTHFRQVNAKKVITNKLSYNSSPVIYLPKVSNLQTTKKQFLSSLQLNKHLFYLLSSGTTGTAKVIVHTLNAFYEHVAAVKLFMYLNSNTVYLLNLPLFHVSGLGIVFRTFLSGAKLVISNKDNWVKDISEFKVTHLSMVETQVKQCLNGNETIFLGIKVLLLGGSKFSNEILDRLITQKVPVFLSYGLTEAATQVFTKNLLTGKSLHLMDIICKDKQILIKGKQLFKGYYTEGLTVLPLTQTDYFETRDLGIMKNLELKILGRSDNCFISGGENIFPEEIEGVIQTHSFVKRVIVIPIPDQLFQFKPVAFVDINNQNFNLNDLYEFVQDKLPNFKQPVNYYHWPSSYPETGIKLNRTWFQAYMNNNG